MSRTSTDQNNVNRFDPIIAAKLLKEITVVKCDTPSTFTLNQLDDYSNYLTQNLVATQLSINNWKDYFWHPKIESIESIKLDLDLSSQTSLMEMSYIDNCINILMAKGIKIPEPQTVQNYLQQAPDIANLLISTASLAKDKVDSETQLSLEIYKDHEMNDEYPTLYIRKEHYDDAILEFIESITAGFEEQLTNKSGWFIVTTDFKSPR